MRKIRNVSVESLESKANEALTELEFHLLSHPDYSSDENHFVSFGPPKLVAEKAEKLLEENLDEAAAIGKQAGKIIDQLEEDDDTNRSKVRWIRRYSADLVRETEKLLGTNKYTEWAYETCISDGNKRKISEDIGIEPRNESGYIRE